MLLLLGSRLLVLPLLLGAACAAPAADGGAEPALSFPREEASLNEMFREVEELMEDTQSKLQSAVKEMEAEEEGAKKPSEVDFENLPPSYHNESNTHTRMGNKTIHTHQEIDKVTDNKTGSTIYSETVITSIKDEESKRNHMNTFLCSQKKKSYCLDNPRDQELENYLHARSQGCVCPSKTLTDLDRDRIPPPILNQCFQSVCWCAPRTVQVCCDILYKDCCWCYPQKTNCTACIQACICGAGFCIKENKMAWRKGAVLAYGTKYEFMECIIDEDCETGKYCQFSSFEYHCQLCKTQHSPCSRDVECCGEQLCVWGECVEAASKGENGTICENQHDCNPGTCCAFQKDLLFPVCTPLPAAGEPCHDPSNKLLNLITWELEPDGVLGHCPCGHGLICQTHSPGTLSVCELSFNETGSNEKEDPLLMDEIPFLGLIPRNVLSDYEDSSIIQAMQKELESLEENMSEQTAVEEPDLAHDLLFGDEI